MPNPNDIVITDELRAAYAKRYITDEGTIKSFEYVKAQTSKRLKTLVKFTPAGNISYGNKALVAFIKELRPDGGPINYSWVISRVGEELYMRDVMDEDDYLRLQEVLG